VEAWDVSRKYNRVTDIGVRFQNKGCAWEREGENYSLETDEVSDCLLDVLFGIFTALCSTPRDSLEVLTVRPGEACDRTESHGAHPHNTPGTEASHGLRRTRSRKFDSISGCFLIWPYRYNRQFSGRAALSSGIKIRRPAHQNSATTTAGCQLISVVSTSSSFSSCPVSCVCDVESRIKNHAHEIKIK
jgi:hypothetical protein